MNLHGQNFVGDQLSLGTGKTFRAVSPLDSTPLPPEFHLSGEKEVNAALEIAEQAFETYRESTGGQRAAFLERIADEIMALGDDLINRAHQETGLPEGTAWSRTEPSSS